MKVDDKYMGLYEWHRVNPTTDAPTSQPSNSPTGSPVSSWSGTIIPFNDIPWFKPLVAGSPTGQDCVVMNAGKTGAEANNGRLVTFRYLQS